MGFFFGKYRLGREVVGTARRWCGTCKKETRWQRQKAAECGHVLCVPILPLGKRAAWRCESCGNAPYGEERVQLWIKLVLVVALFPYLVALLAVSDSLIPQQDRAIIGWVRTVASFGYILFGAHVISETATRRKAQKRESEILEHDFVNDDAIERAPRRLFRRPFGQRTASPINARSAMTKVRQALGTANQL
jgi:hypothetical protein